MNLTVIGVGALKERYWRDACAEYLKRLTAYCRPEVIEVKDERTPEKLSETERNLILRKEGARILEKAGDRTFLIAADLRGSRCSSEQFAEALSEWEIRGRGNLTFVIGGSLGLSEEVLRRADVRVSFSDLTFPHQLMRVILLEQIYRAFRIRTGAPYHK